jgi:ATP-dependent DNA helicase RecG
MNWEIQHPEWEPLEIGEEQHEKGESLNLWRIVPVYGLTEGLSQRMMRRIVRQCLDQYAARLPDPVPLSIQRKHQMRTLAEAMEGVHFPSDPKEPEACRNRLAFTEAYGFMSELRRMRASGSESSEVSIVSARGPDWLKDHNPLPAAVMVQLGFDLHEGQRRVIQSLGRRIAAGDRFRCLLQADVGAGKTLAALGPLLAATSVGGRGVIMAPTVILARQHYERLKPLCAAAGCTIGWVAGGQSLEERRAESAADIVVGTHALLESKFRLNQVTLLVIDEQHRFGVRQRQALYSRAPGASVLVMSATPIPRTLAKVQYADLEIMLMRERPDHKTNVKTILLTSGQAGKAYELLHSSVQDLEQRGYVIFPSIDGLGRISRDGLSDPRMRTLAWSGIFDGAARLEQGFLRGIPMIMVHGRMSEEEKAEAMGLFAKGTKRILLGTTVVEVGVDVPQATVMIVEHAERFGLATLHQLRGRVGRGTIPSYCFLIARGADAEERQRLRILVESTDGFEIAERDLLLRGQGEVSGERQSGPTEFRVFRPGRDHAILDLVVQGMDDQNGDARRKNE